MSATSHTVDVPFLDLRYSHAPLRDTILEEIGALLDTGAFTNGAQVQAFESAFAAFCGLDHCVGVANGLDALRLLLLARGLEPGDEVLVPANTFVASAEAVTQAGGVPVLVDASEADYNLDPAAAESAIGPRTRFILPVHLYGQMADMRAIGQVAERHGLTIVEDACQAHGAERDGVRPGDEGDAAFSFYPGKNLGAIGDAGAAITRNAEVAATLRALREHGQRAKYDHALVGWTARLDTIQAIALLHKLPHLRRWTEERRAIAGYYQQHLTGMGDLILPPVANASHHVWHLFVVRTGDPAALGSFLRERGIGTGRHYPQPVHLTEAYRHLGYFAGAFPVAEAIAQTCLSLPVFPGMSEQQLAATVAAIRSYFS